MSDIFALPFAIAIGGQARICGERVEQMHRDAIVV